MPGAVHGVDKMLCRTKTRELETELPGQVFEIGIRDEDYPVAALAQCSPQGCDGMNIPGSAERDHENGQDFGRRRIHLRTTPLRNRGDMRPQPGVQPFQ